MEPNPSVLLVGAGPTGRFMRRIGHEYSQMLGLQSRAPHFGLAPSVRLVFLDGRC